MATPLRPPRATGDPATDSVAALEYQWAIYKAIFEEQEFLRISDASGFATTAQLDALGLGTAAVVDGAAGTYTPVAANDALYVTTMTHLFAIGR